MTTVMTGLPGTTGHVADKCFSLLLLAPLSMACKRIQPIKRLPARNKTKPAPGRRISPIPRRREETTAKAPIKSQRILPRIFLMGCADSLLERLRCSFLDKPCLQQLAVHLLPIGLQELFQLQTAVLHRREIDLVEGLPAFPALSGF